MKKVFIIISSVIMSLTLIMILVMSLVKVNVKMDIVQDPDEIYIYNKSTVAYTPKSTTSSGLKSTDKEYKDIMKHINDMTNISVFTRLMNGIGLDSKPEQDLDGTYIKYANDLKTTHIAVELLYTGSRDSIVYYKGNSKTVNYSAIIFVIPINEGVGDVTIYFSQNNSTTNREEYYGRCVPVHVKANTKNITKYVDNLTQNAS